MGYCVRHGHGLVVAALKRELAEALTDIDVAKGAIAELNLRLSKGATSWIALADRVPEAAGRYLVGAKGINPGEARYKPRSQEWKFPSAAMRFEATHWMPLPEAPK